MVFRVLFSSASGKATGLMRAYTSAVRTNVLQVGVRDQQLQRGFVALRTNCISLITEDVYCCIHSQQPLGREANSCALRSRRRLPQWYSGAEHTQKRGQAAPSQGLISSGKGQMPLHGPGIAN